MLRALITIVPYGDERHAEDLYRLDICNVKTLQRNGFGHDVCEYTVDVWQHNNETIRTRLGDPEWEQLPDRFKVIHDRRDGCISLVQKACLAVEDRI